MVIIGTSGDTPRCASGGSDAYARGVARADLDKQPTDVRRMFDTVAKRYDLTNDLMTAGIQRTWRRSMVDAVAPQRGDLVLDLAAGTGCSSEPFGVHGATAVPCDFSVGMLQQGKKDRPSLPFVAGDGTRLPFLDDTFDAVTISYGLRNFVDPVAGLREMLRVTRPGGRLVVCEFSTPTNGALRTLYLDGFMQAGTRKIIRNVKVSDVLARTRYRPTCNVVSLRRGQNGAVVVVDDAEPHRSSLLWLVE